MFHNCDDDHYAAFKQRQQNADKAKDTHKMLSLYL